MEICAADKARTTRGKLHSTSLHRTGDILSISGEEWYKPAHNPNVPVQAGASMADWDCQRHVQALDGTHAGGSVPGEDRGAVLASPRGGLQAKSAMSR
jgi:hypothetical protein